MICNTCGTENNQESKFCTNCGEELQTPDNSRTNVCQNCGTENDLENKFCIICGSRIAAKDYNNENSIQNKKNSSKQIRRKKSERVNANKGKNNAKYSSNKSLKILWIMVGAVIITVLILTTSVLISNKTSDKIPIEQVSTNPATEAKVYEIASKFVCSCGTCNEESLESCKCERAVEERQIIRSYVEQNNRSEDIIVAVANKYGWMKAEFASIYDVDPSKVWNPNQLKISKEITSSSLMTTNIKATNSDKFTIYYAFNCACGQCSIDELKDCNCPHPKGAKEVKKFIDEKINESKYTVNEIIDLVDNTYGGKKS